MCSSSSACPPPSDRHRPAPICIPLQPLCNPMCTHLHPRCTPLPLRASLHPRCTPLPFAHPCMPLHRLCRRTARASALRQCSRQNNIDLNIARPKPNLVSHPRLHSYPHPTPMPTPASVANCTLALPRPRSRSHPHHRPRPTLTAPSQGRTSSMYRPRADA